MTVKTTPRPASAPQANHDPLNAPRWASLIGSAVADGVLEDFTGTGWKVTADGSSTTVTVGAVGQKISVRGHRGEITAAETFALGALTAGQQRYTRVVASLNLTTYLVTAAVRTGSAAATGTAVIPPLVRDASTYDVSLATVLQTGTAAITQANITDLRTWTGGHASVATDGELVGELGSTRTWRGSLWLRSLVSGSPAWTEVAPQVRPTSAEGIRTQDDTVPAGTDAVITSCSVPGAGRQVQVIGTARIAQGVTTGNVDLSVTLNGATITSFRFVMGVGELVVPIVGLATASVNNPTVPIVLRARTSAGTLTVRTGSRIVATAL